MKPVEDDDKRIQIAKSFGTNLLKLRKERGFTREELAEQSNLSSNYIYGLETGTYLPGCIALIDLSNALNVTPTQLLDKHLYNKKEIILEKLSHNIDNLSDRDFNLLLSIIDFLNKNNEEKNDTNF